MMTSLCETCAAMREILTPKGSRFLLCQLSVSVSSFPKYPPQPVVRCEGYRLAITEKANETPMLPLYRSPHFTFRFADDRLIPRFHLEGIATGRSVAIYQLDPATGQRLELLTKATVGETGWVDLEQPIIVRAGEGFIAVVELTE